MQSRLRYFLTLELKPRSRKRPCRVVARGASGRAESRGAQSSGAGRHGILQSRRAQAKIRERRRGICAVMVDGAGLRVDAPRHSEWTRRQWTAIGHRGNECQGTEAHCERLFQAPCSRHAPASVKPLPRSPDRLFEAPQPHAALPSCPSSHTCSPTCFPTPLAPGGRLQHSSVVAAAVHHYAGCGSVRFRSLDAHQSPLASHHLPPPTLQHPTARDGIRRALRATTCRLQPTSLHQRVPPCICFSEPGLRLRSWSSLQMTVAALRTSRPSPSAAGLASRRNRCRRCPRTTTT